jgi:hypothetical protein
VALVVAVTVRAVQLTQRLVLLIAAAVVAAAVLPLELRPLAVQVSLIYVGKFEF